MQQLRLVGRRKAGFVRGNKGFVTPNTSRGVGRVEEFSFCFLGRRALAQTTASPFDKLPECFSPVLELLAITLRAAELPKPGSGDA